MLPPLNLITLLRSYNMPTYSAADVINKTLIARKPVAIKRSPSLSQPTVYTAKSGDTIGVVYSYIQNNDGLWWMYYDQYQKPYYTLHDPNSYDIKSLSAQGAISLEEVKAAEEKAADPVDYYITKFAAPIMWSVVAYIAFQAYLDYDAAQPKKRRK